jgi:hypothetical protein
MEFCAGGGIIDMMNRRLRERLAEHEILQIFVDVCEVRQSPLIFTPAVPSNPFESLLGSSIHAQLHPCSASP